MQTILKSDKIAEVVTRNPQLILVLERLNIFLGVENKTIEELAIEKELNPELVVLLLNMQQNEHAALSLRLSETDIRTVISYLTVSHAYFTDELYPVITSDIDRMVGDKRQPAMQMLKTFFKEYRKEADAHFDYENRVAFPYMLKLMGDKPASSDLQEDYSIDMYRQHHDNIEEKLDDLMQLLIKYLPHDENYRIRRQIILNISQLDNDLKVHARIEDNVLIPAIEELEKKLDRLNY